MILYIVMQDWWEENNLWGVFDNIKQAQDLIKTLPKTPNGDHDGITPYIYRIEELELNKVYDKCH